MARETNCTHDCAGVRGAGLVSPLLGESGPDEVEDEAPGDLLFWWVAVDGNPYTSGAVSAFGGAMVTPLIVMPDIGLVVHPAIPQFDVGVPLTPAIV